MIFGQLCWLYASLDFFVFMNFLLMLSKESITKVTSLNYECRLLFICYTEGVRKYFCSAKSFTTAMHGLSFDVNVSLRHSQW